MKAIQTKTPPLGLSQRSERLATTLAQPAPFPSFQTSLHWDRPRWWRRPLAAKPSAKRLRPQPFGRRRGFSRPPSASGRVAEKNFLDQAALFVDAHIRVVRAAVPKAVAMYPGSQAVVRNAKLRRRYPHERRRLDRICLAVKRSGRWQASGRRAKRRLPWRTTHLPARAAAEGR